MKFKDVIESMTSISNTNNNNKNGDPNSTALTAAELKIPEIAAASDKLNKARLLRLKLEREKNKNKELDLEKRIADSTAKQF